MLRSTKRKRNLAKKLRDRRGGKSCYARYNKRECDYSSVPLHRQGEGLEVTPDNVRRFLARLGLT